MKKALVFLTPLLLLPLAFSCGDSGETTPVKLRYGSAFASDSLIEGNSHLTASDAEKVNSLLSDKENFILLVKDTSDGCVCWSSFHDEVMGPYLKKHGILAYLISLTDFKTVEGYSSLGLSLYSGAVTMGIFREGKLAFQNNTKDLKSEWVNNKTFFASWMDARLTMPKIFRIEEAGLEKLYEGTTPFTIYFGRDKCGDCGYFDINSLYPYLDSKENLSREFYYMDCDIWRDNLDAKAYAEKKAEYGLALEEGNPAGYSSGAFPTLYYVHPDGKGTKKGDVIELSSVFYNEMLDGDMKVTGSYFTDARYESSKASSVHFLEYADAIKENKVIEGITLSIEGYDKMSKLEQATAKKNALKPYEQPLIEAFLDYAVGNK